MKLDDMMNPLIDPPYGYRLVDKVKDAPKRNGDLFWYQGKWQVTVEGSGVFDEDFTYARKIEIPKGWELIPQGEPIMEHLMAYSEGEWERTYSGGFAGKGIRNFDAYIRRAKPRDSESCCCREQSDHTPKFAVKSDYAATETKLPNGTKVWLHTEDPAILLERIGKLEMENADLRSKLSGIPHVIGKNAEASFRDMLTKEGVMG